MENKYFTPNIEDIRVGYECERDFSDTTEIEEWRNTVIEQDHFKSFYIEDIRTPYLTKEQIEAEGWVVMNTGGIEPGQINGRYGFSKGNYFMIWYPETQLIDIILRDPSKEERVWNPERFRFFCECKDINTLRLISKLLGLS